MARTAELKRPIPDAAPAGLAAPVHQLNHAPADDRPPAPGRVSELRVSAHLMTLEIGLYCVFPTPGSPDPDIATGLPGVRVTPAPGFAGRPEAVTVSTFREDGWLNGTAALVRVTESQAQILVSVYQDVRQQHDGAPRLQVLRLSKQLNGAAADRQSETGNFAPAGGLVPTVPDPEVMAHVRRTGDVAGKVGDWIGVRGSGQWMEGFGISPNVGVSRDDVEYQGVLGRNWLSPWVEGGKFCGSRGMALPLLGLKIRLKGRAAETFECSYSATFLDGSAVGPVREGEACEAESLAPLEAFQVVIRDRGAEQAQVKDKKPVLTPKPKAAVKPAAKPSVKPAGRR
jgi:Clostridial hydrophobic W